MKDFEEQCVCMKFCLKLDEAFMETFQIWKQAYGNSNWVGSTKDDPKTEWFFTSMDDDHVEKVLAVICENCGLTVKFLKKQASVRVCATQFPPQNWRCIMLLQNLCHIVLQMSKNMKCDMVSQ
jgi:hypothetical protein